MREYQLTEYEDALRDFHIKRSRDITRAQAMHFHDYYQIYYIAAGSMTHRIGGAAAALSAGDAALVPPLTAHCIADAQDVEFFAVSFQTSFLPRETADGMLGEFLLSVRSCEQPLPRLTLPGDMPSQVRLHLSTMLAEFQAHEIAYVNVLQGLLPAVLALLARACQALPAYALHAEGLEEKRRSILACTERMRRDLAARTTLDEEAHKSLMSRAQFCKAFQEVTGTSFVKYRTRLRIDKAASLLREDGRTIEQIAACCGFSEYSSFYRCFLDIIGISPASYRKLGDSRRAPGQE